MTDRPLYTAADIVRETEEPDKGLPAEPYRSPWRTDYARLVHSPAFRRLQGKTQLFPGESDFFRNRLTHSIEVAQIAKSIAIKLNYEHFRHKPNPLLADSVFALRISEDLVEFAGLAHDLGHPPFGHNGEKALDECMCTYGGFEGNAQTLRILCRVEKKRTRDWPPVEFADGVDLRRGLNLTLRSLGAVLKYDQQIPSRAAGSECAKGYYESEAVLVGRIKKAVIGEEHFEGKFKTIECQIMDIADDIAYSTYDFEDAMKVGFTSMLDVLRVSREKRLLRRVALKVWKRLKGRTDAFSEDCIPPEVLPQIEEMETQVITTLFETSSGILPREQDIAEAAEGAAPASRLKDLLLVAYSFQNSESLRENGYLRIALTSQLVGEFIQGIRFKFNSSLPPLSQVSLDDDIRRKIEILKNYTFERHIEAARLKTVEYRGKEIVKSIFKCLSEDKKNQLLPVDWKRRCESVANERDRLRIICDFVAGMTDAYASEFYERLTSGASSTIFKDVN